MRSYTHLSVLRHSTLPYIVIYVVMHHGAWLYYIFTLRTSLYTILCITTLVYHHMRLFTWLYHIMRGYALNAWLYTFICTLAFHCTTWCVVIPIIRVCNHIIYTYSIVLYIVTLFQHCPLCLVTTFSKYVSTQFFIHTLCTYTVGYQTT